jgi:hypothetical protein
LRSHAAPAGSDCDDRVSRRWEPPRHRPGVPRRMYTTPPLCVRPRPTSWRHHGHRHGQSHHSQRGHEPQPAGEPHQSMGRGLLPARSRCCCPAQADKPHRRWSQTPADSHSPNPIPTSAPVSVPRQRRFSGGLHSVVRRSHPLRHVRNKVTAMIIDIGGTGQPAQVHRQQTGTSHARRALFRWLRPGRRRRPGHRQRSAAQGRLAVLRDGSTVLIRQVQPADASLLAEGFTRLSVHSHRMRFLTRKTSQELRCQAAAED